MTAPTELPDPRAGIVSSKRPWGDFEQYAVNESVTVKVITVEPGHRLSLQTHRDRAELWVVLDGPIRVSVEDRTWDAQRGERVWVPQGAVHRMANTSEAPGRVLEVGYGHFDEDDIVRIEDDYAR